MIDEFKNMIKAIKDWTLSKIKTKSDIDSPVFTGVPKAPTADSSDNSTRIATTAFVKTLINALVNGAPETLDTLKEIADTITENETIVEALNDAIGKKVDKIEGKGLSTNDFTNKYKSKLDVDYLPLSGGILTGNVYMEDNKGNTFYGNNHNKRLNIDHYGINYDVDSYNASSFEINGRNYNSDYEWWIYLDYSDSNDAVSFYPETNIIETVTNLGYPGAHNKWTNIYATNGTIQTSDRNEKNTINELTAEKAQNLIYGLKPSTYQMNNGTSGRTHWGMISQDIEELLEQLGWISLDFAGFIKSPKIEIMHYDEDGSRLDKPIEKVIKGEYEYSLRYDEFIAPIIKVIQTQHKEIETLKQEISELLNKEA